jgi:hypothetical protein
MLIASIEVLIQSDHCKTFVSFATAAFATHEANFMHVPHGSSPSHCPHFYLFRIKQHIDAFTLIFRSRHLKQAPLFRTLATSCLLSGSNFDRDRSTIVPKETEKQDKEASGMPAKAFRFRTRGFDADMSEYNSRASGKFERRAETFESSKGWKRKGTLYAKFKENLFRHFGEES